MLIPLSWLNEFVNIDKKNLKDLMWKMTEAGLTCESYQNHDAEIVLEFEITPNRPDWMSVFGIAREIAAITGSKLKTPEFELKSEKSKFPLEININPDYKIVPRITSVIIQGVTVAPSPDWMQKRIREIGLRPINNLVDITNYILWMYGGLLHAFDYDKIKNHQMNIELSKGGEKFRSLDGIDYILPKNAIIIKDSEKIIDLLPLKGGENTSSTFETKNVLLHSVIADPVLTRKTSQSLKFKSDSSSIAEKGLDPNGTIIALNHALSLILELAGGRTASDIIDNKEKEFIPSNVSLNPERLKKVLGISITKNEVFNILDKLNLSPKLIKNEIICIIPTYRLDLKIEEDIIEEVARIYGYNLFPKSLPKNPPSVKTIAYQFSDEIEKKVKNILVGTGFSETYTYSLISKNLINLLSLNLKNAVKIENPVSLEFEYLRPLIVGNLLEAIKLNQSNFEKISLFELGRVYLKNDLYSEINMLSIIANTGLFHDFKGVLELIFERLGINNIHYSNLKNNELNFLDQNQKAAIFLRDKYLGYFGKISLQTSNTFGIKSDILSAELNFDLLKENISIVKFKEIGLYPATIEDLTITLKEKSQVGDIIKKIYSADSLIKKVEIISEFENNITFRIYFQSAERNLTKKDTLEILKELSKIFKE